MINEIENMKENQVKNKQGDIRSFIKRLDSAKGTVKPAPLAEDMARPSFGNLNFKTNGRLSETTEEREKSKKTLRATHSFNSFGDLVQDLGARTKNKEQGPIRRSVEKKKRPNLPP